MTKTKMKAKEKLLLENWPQIFIKLLRPPNQPKIADNIMFLVLLAIFSGAFSEASFKPLFEESETSFFKQFCPKFYFSF